MSSINENYKEFLKNYNNQIQPFDLVCSSRVKPSTELNVFDIVLFENGSIGTDMHRIVDIKTFGDDVTLLGINKTVFEGHDTFELSNKDSTIYFDKGLRFTDFKLVSYSKDPIDHNYYIFWNDAFSFRPEFNSYYIDGYYKNEISYSVDKPITMTFGMNKRKDLNNDFIECIIFNNNEKESILASDINESNEQKILFNAVVKYLIRGDKASTDDGWFSKDLLISKVNIVIPKLGFLIRFLSSPWGTIMLVGLAIIPFAYDAFSKKKGKEHYEQKNN